MKGPPAIQPPDITQHYEPITDPDSEFAWHHPQTHQPQEEEEENLHNCSAQFHDPWENYRGNVPAPHNVVNAEDSSERNDIRNYAWEYKQEHIEQLHQPYVPTHSPNIWQPPSQTQHHQEHRGNPYHENNLQQDHGSQSNDHMHHQYLSNHRNDDEHKESHNSPEKPDPQYQVDHYFHEINEHVITNGHSSNHPHEDSNWNIRHNIINVTQDILGPAVQNISNGFTNGQGGDEHNEDDFHEDIRPRHPYDGYYLRHQPTVDVNGRKICSHEVPTPPPSPPPNTVSDFESSPDSQVSFITIF